MIGIRGIKTKSVTKHGVDTQEAESVFKLGSSFPLGEQTFPEHEEQRLGIIGPSYKGRLLQVAFTLREGRVRIISARLAHKKERLKYEESIRKIFERV